MRVLLKLVLLLSFFSSLIIAEPTFPKLTGRVVDDASLLTSNKEERLTQILAQHEQKTSNQVVIVTLATLQGYEIEEYGYQLGRYWGIGQKGKDNGVLLIVAPNERKVRIEVGYGLEGTLTDKIAHDIIQEKILPAFKRENYVQGIENGTSAILQALDGEYEITKVSNKTQNEEGSSIVTVGIIAIIFLSIVVEAFLSGKSQSTRFKIAVTISTVLAIIVYFLFLSLMASIVVWIISFFQMMFGESGSGGYSSSGGFSSGGSFGGFSGGGGSFGGGGASGSW
ncbi:TPM domain-containing protein [Sulfurimonas sp.]|uniref:TPM domain-containing protein n=1 Tax=Sulfurimonas sp. TaxID=2022749 RepID=UPI003D13DF78